MAPGNQHSQWTSENRHGGRGKPRTNGTDWSDRELPWYADLEAVPVARDQNSPSSRIGLRDILSAWAFYAVLLAGLFAYTAVSDFVAQETPRQEIKAQKLGQDQSRALRGDRLMIARLHQSGS